MILAAITFNLVNLIVGLIIVFLLWWANQKLAPEPIKTVLKVVIVVVFVLWLLSDLGLMGSSLRITAVPACFLPKNV